MPIFKFNVRTQSTQIDSNTFLVNFCLLFVYNPQIKFNNFIEDALKIFDLIDIKKMCCINVLRKVCFTYLLCVPMDVNL